MRDEGQRDGNRAAINVVNEGSRKEQGDDEPAAAIRNFRSDAVRAWPGVVP